MTEYYFKTPEIIIDFDSKNQFHPLINQFKLFGEAFFRILKSEFTLTLIVFNLIRVIREQIFLDSQTVVVYTSVLFLDRASSYSMRSNTTGWVNSEIRTVISIQLKHMG